LLLGSSVYFFSLRAQHHDARFAIFVDTDANSRMTLRVGNQLLGLLILIGERNARYSLTGFDSTRIRPPIEDIEGRSPPGAVSAFLLSDSDAIG
jgi:hypothetical protein